MLIAFPMLANVRYTPFVSANECRHNITKIKHTEIEMPAVEIVRTFAWLRVLQWARVSDKYSMLWGNRKKRLFFSLISCVCVCCTLHAPSNIPDKRRWCAEVCHANITLDSCSLNDYSILKTYWMRNECFRTIRILFEATWICCDDSMSPVHYLNDGLVLHAIQSNKNANGLCFY